VLRERLERVLERIQQACQRCGRDPSSVTLIGVTKGVPPALIQEAIALGMTELGENRVQEAREKRLVLGPTPGVRWHLIGHLQRNKAKDAVELFDVIHSVDSLALIQELDRRVTGRPLEVMVQVNVSGEATKFGCRPDEAVSLAEAVRRTTHLMLRGLMTIAPFAEDADAARPHFRRLRLLRDELASSFQLPRPDHSQRRGGPASSFRLSMGMSQDFEVAIEEGADVVRIGTAIFGERA
jgi:pyridoxal phosphate enzyme (YggS family)